MTDGETSLMARLILIGAIIGLGQLLAGSDQITVRAIIGRMIMGSAVSLLAGIPLINFADMPELTVIGIASALGILGSEIIKEFLKRWVGNRLAQKKDKT